MNNTRYIEVEKVICKNELKDVLISKWSKPKGYDFYWTEIRLTPLSIYTHLVFGKYSEFKKFIKNMHDFDTEHKDCIAMVVKLKDQGVTWNYMLIQENDWRPDHYNTICHELHHLTHFTLGDKGIVYGEGGEELFAYVQGYLMEMVVRAFVELKRVIKRRK